MSKQIYLEPDQLEELEPFEELPDKMGMQWISPFAVPDVVELDLTHDDALRLRFRYPGGETGDRVVNLPTLSGRAVSLLLGRATSKILTVFIKPPVRDAAGLEEVAGEIRVAAMEPTEPGMSISQRFSHNMVARVLEHWSKELADLIPGSPGEDRGRVNGG